MYIFIFCLIFILVFFSVGSIVENLISKDKKLKIYISGPMTGYKDLNFSAFIKMEEQIVNNFYFVLVVNPVKIAQKVKSKKYVPNYEDYLREDLKYLIACDAVFLLPGWENSSGCEKEITVAKFLKIPCFSKYNDLIKFIEEKNEY